MFTFESKLSSSANISSKIEDSVSYLLASTVNSQSINLIISLIIVVILLGVDVPRV